MIAQAFTIAMIVIFFHATTWDDHIFAGVKKIIRPQWKISKPLYTCPICMTPWWGSLIYWIFFYTGSWQDWVLTVLTAAGISTLNVILLYAKEYFAHKTK